VAQTIGVPSPMTTVAPSGEQGPAGWMSSVGSVVVGPGVGSPAAAVELVAG
jgi:hypothetical protein